MITADTIIAPATAVGDGGIAVVRISGPRSLEALKRFFHPTVKSTDFQTHRLYHGIMVDQRQQHVDEVLAVYMAAPHTYTRDDVVEIHCHGSQQVVKAILNTYLEFGLRIAQPGEFTYRAFVSGRLDLSQAEAVAQLIHCKTDSSRKLALSQVEGLLSRQIHEITDDLRNTQVFLEAWIDFPEEDLPVEDLNSIRQKTSDIVSRISELSSTYNTGKFLIGGASILLVGRPNAGKSSLMNVLLGEERAIVTDIPGTTRDILEEGLSVAGVPIRLIDTAGLRQTNDPIETEGVRRATKKVEQADLVLLLIDGSKGVDEQDLYAHKVCSGSSAFLVTTKQDLTPVADPAFCGFPEFQISTKSGQGIEQLRTAIAGFLLGDHQATAESVMISEQRHYDALISCRRNLCLFLDNLNTKQPLEFSAFEIREALYHLGQISGETTSDDILAGIFSQFCIGK